VRQRLYSENAEYISFNFYDVIPRLLPTHFIDAVSAEIKMLLTVCDEIFLKHVDWPHKIDKALELIFYLLEDRYASIDENPTTATIKRFIKNNLKNKLTLYDIARHVGYSPCHCDTLFKKETGYSIIKYLVNERICEAKRLLEEGTLSLKNIAESVGFEDYNFFSRTFKKFTGRTPTEYKSLKNHKSKIK
jgi:AraC-like DNA-binding protein